MRFATSDANGGGIRAALIGHTCIDENIVDGVPRERCWGSAVLFAREYLAQQHGVVTSVVASYGRDFAALWPELEIANSPTGDRTLLYENSTVGGVTNRRVFHTGNSRPVPLDDALRRLIRDADLVIVAPLLANYDAPYLADLRSLARADAKFVLLAQGFLRHVTRGGTVERRTFVEADAVLALVDVVVVSDDDVSAEWVTAAAEASRWSTAHPALKVVVTRNALGATLFANGEESTFAVPAINNAASAHPVGAGDIFGTALSLSYVRSGDIREAVTGGNRAAQDFLSN